MEAFKNKANEATELALDLKKENEKMERLMQKSPGGVPDSVVNSPYQDSGKKSKDLERKVTKMRNDNSKLQQLVDKATRLLEREIGEIVDINELYKEESQWKGRS